jgi:hypothetical protein
MSKTILDIKKSRGRPKEAGTGTLIGTRWHEPELSEVDDWRRDQPDIPGRAEAVRRLVRMGLDSDKRKPKNR